MGHTASIRRALAADSHGVEDSSSSGSGSGSSNGSTGQPLRQQQFATVANGGSSSRAASALPAVALTSCEQQLLQQLGFAPEAVEWLQPTDSIAETADNLCVTLCCLLQRPPGSVGRVPHHMRRGRAACRAAAAMGGSSKALLTAADCAGAMRRVLGIPEVRPHGWALELLGGLVQLACLLGEQPDAPGAPGSAAATTGQTGSTSSSTHSGTARAACAGHLLWLLTGVSRLSPAQFETHQASGSEHGDWSDSSTGTVPESVPPVAARFVQFGSALETALRTVTVGVQRGTVSRLGLPTRYMKRSAVCARFCCCLETLQSLG
jgi:hypothetical protein